MIASDVAGYRWLTCWTCEQQVCGRTVQFSSVRYTLKTKCSQSARHQWIYIYHSPQHASWA